MAGRVFGLWLAGVALAVALAPAWGEEASKTATVRLLGADGAALGVVRAEVAATAAQRRRGLSGRREVAAGTGMLFVFEPPRARVCFWMKDTYVPLAALFADAGGEVMFAARMQAESLEMHCAGSEARPVRHVLEVRADAEVAGVRRIVAGAGADLSSQ